MVSVVIEAGVDGFLRRYEARPATTTADEQRKRREGLRLGWEFNRLQGGTACAVSDRLGDLYCAGRISDTEYLQLAAELAGQGLLGRNGGGADGR